MQRLRRALQCTMDSAIGLAEDPIWCLFAEPYQQIKYLRKLGVDVRRMQCLFGTVDGKKNDTIRGLHRQERRVFEVYRVSLDGVEKNGETVALINNVYDQNERWLFGCCPDCWFMFRSGRGTRQCSAGVGDLFDRAKFELLDCQFGEVAPPPATELVPVAELMGRIPLMAQEQIEKWLAGLLVGTRPIAPAQIEKRVADDKARMIGVYGMGGAGKIFFVKNIGLSPHLKGPMQRPS